MQILRFSLVTAAMVASATAASLASGHSRRAA
jgi:hypothetical protein